MSTLAAAAAISAPLTSSAPILDPAALASPVFVHSIEILTPEVAGILVDEHLAPNRRLNPNTSARYRSDMEADLWPFAGDPLRFDVNGLLIDGQHRVHAVAEIEDPGFSLPFVVMRGLPSETIMAMDQGMKRTAGQQLGLTGMRNAIPIAAAARLCLFWDEGRFRLGATSINRQVSTSQIESWIDTNRVLVDHVNDHMGDLRGVSAPLGPVAAAAIILARIDPALEADFFSKLHNGGEPQGSPILTLDKRFVRMLRDGSSYSSSEYMGMIFRAWNAWRRGEQLLKIVRPSEMTSFPVPV